MMSTSHKILVHTSSLSCNYILYWTTFMVNGQGRRIFTLNSSCFQEEGFFLKHTGCLPWLVSLGWETGHSWLGSFLSHSLLGARLPYTLFFALLLEKFLRTASTWNPVGVHRVYDWVVLSSSGSFILRSPLWPHTKGTFSNPAILSNEGIILIFIFLLLDHFLMDSEHSCGNPK